MANGSLSQPNLTKVLIVDEDPLVLNVLEAQLAKEGFEVTSVEAPKKALDELRLQKYSVIAAAEEMQAMPGLEVLKQAKQLNEGVVRVLLNSKLSLKELFEAIQSDVIHRYVTKPWIVEDLLAIIKNAVSCQLAGPAKAGNGPAAAPQPEAKTQDAAAADTETEGKNIYTVESADVAVATYIKMLGAFHPNLGSTASRTMALCQTLGDVLDLELQEARSLAWAGALHDLGLINIERAIVRRFLRSPDKCTEEELMRIKQHPKESQAMLADTPIFEEAGEMILHHHEYWDGGGYPDHLKEESIPWLSRVLSAAIYYCSKHTGNIQAMNDLEAQKEKMFDPRAVEAVAKAVPKTKLPRGIREILIIELQPGMVLARDIYNTSGLLIIAQGKELTTAWINKINNINNATPLNPNVLVYC